MPHLNRTMIANDKIKKKIKNELLAIIITAFLVFAMITASLVLKPDLPALGVYGASYIFFFTRATVTWWMDS